MTQKKREPWDRNMMWEEEDEPKSATSSRDEAEDQEDEDDEYDVYDDDEDEEDEGEEEGYDDEDEEGVEEDEGVEDEDVDHGDDEDDGAEALPVPPIGGRKEQQTPGPPARPLRAPSTRGGGDDSDPPLMFTFDDRPVNAREAAAASPKGTSIAAMIQGQRFWDYIWGVDPEWADRVASAKQRGEHASLNGYTHRFIKVYTSGRNGYVALIQVPPEGFDPEDIDENNNTALDRYLEACGWPHKTLVLKVFRGKTGYLTSKTFQPPVMFDSRVVDEDAAQAALIKHPAANGNGAHPAPVDDEDEEDFDDEEEGDEEDSGMTALLGRVVDLVGDPEYLQKLIFVVGPAYTAWRADHEAKMEVARLEARAQYQRQQAEMKRRIDEQVEREVRQRVGSIHAPAYSGNRGVTDD